MVTIGDIVKIMETIADPGLAESWDNCGLQVGRLDQPVKKIMTALDPLPEVVSYACSTGTDLLITHHPLIFRPLKQIDSSTYPGSVINMALSSNLGIYSAHTSLDSSYGGLNDYLAEKLGILKTSPLLSPGDDVFVKLVVFTPRSHREKILDALAQTTAGVIDDYTCCSFSGAGEGSFKPGKGSAPFIGEKNEMSTAEEYRIETIVKRKNVSSVTGLLKKVHPYETMAYDVYPLVSTGTSEGLGRIGYLEKTLLLSDLIKNIKSCLNIANIRIAGKTEGDVRCVALCTGSGSSLMQRFLHSPADVYISGDLSYHDARNAEEKGKTLIDVGHFASEIIVSEMLCDKIGQKCQEKGISVITEVCKIEKEPFKII